MKLLLLLVLSSVVLIVNATPYYGNENLPTIKLKVDPSNVHPTVLWLVSLFSDRVENTQGSTVGFQGSQAYDIERTRQRIQQLGMDLRELVTIQGRSYFFTDSQLNNNDAMNFCNDLGLTMISLETQKEQRDVDTYIAQNGKQPTYITSGIWHNGVWKWSGSGSKVTETGWAEGQPYNPNNKDNNLCIYRILPGWHDNNCHDFKGYVLCEQRC